MGGVALVLATTFPAAAEAQVVLDGASPRTVTAQGSAAALPRAGEMGYLNGGIGKEQADLMRDMSAQFPVRMTFSEREEGTDAFVADVHVRVRDAAGRTLLDLPAQGPIFLLRLPQGVYTVEAEHRGEVKTRRFDIVAGRHQDLAFSWS
jgi:hypothetical protein